MNQQNISTSFVSVRLRFALSLVACCFVTSTGVALHADVNFAWVTVGDPGNPPDQLYPDPILNPSNLRFGAVGYAYRISKYEVTNDQYTEFLNGVDAMGTNPNGVYKSEMGDPNPLVRGGIDFDAGAANGSKYSAKTNFGNKPVNWVSFFDAMRFVNWLENGQPTDASGTENGVYTIRNGANETRAPDATFFIPSEDEWYKAAYYDSRLEAAGGPPGDDNYWIYPTMSDSEPMVATANATGDISNPGADIANYNFGADWNGQDGNVTTVGSAGANSASFYGTFDQGGNVYEFNEAVVSSSFRTVRGGFWGNESILLGASFREFRDIVPTFEFSSIGFRVASVLHRADFNDDGVIDCTDIDSLVMEIVAETHNANFDLTGDGFVDTADLDEWRVQGGAANLPSGNPYLVGDATLDGIVDGLDFIEWNNHKFTVTAAWCSGDFNADGLVDGLDFVLWNDNKYTSADGDVVAVPEPQILLLSMVALLAIGNWRIRSEGQQP